MLLSAVPKRMLMRRSRSLSPCRALQTTGADSSCSTGRQGMREALDANRNPLVSTSRVSRKGILSEEASSANVTPHVQYHHLATRWLNNLQGRRSSWAALASRGREHNYWEGAGARESRSGGAAAAGVLSAAAIAFCLKKDSNSKGTVTVTRWLQHIVWGHSKIVAYSWKLMASGD